MAGPAQLVATMSQVTGIVLPTIIDLDRKLVKAGLRTIGGRGLSAARMTPLDAARLLTAVLASPQANMSVDAVERYARTQIDADRSSVHLFDGVGLDYLSRLPATHSFVDALAALIEPASADALAGMVPVDKRGLLPNIEVFAFTRATRGRIRLSGLPGGLTTSVEYTLAPHPAQSVQSKRIVALRAPSTNADLGDLEQSRRVTERTILTLAQLLATEGRDV